MSDTPLTPLLLTTRQAAALLQVSERHLFTLTREHGLPVVWLNKAKRFRPADLERWLAEHVTGGAPCS
jgi:excisionase family DNA binding protein